MVPRAAPVLAALPMLANDAIRPRVVVRTGGGGLAVTPDAPLPALVPALLRLLGRLLSSGCDLNVAHQAGRAHGAHCMQGQLYWRARTSPRTCAAHADASRMPPGRGAAAWSAPLMPP